MTTVLPNELISTIFELAIPPVSFGTQSERTSLLKTIALLSRDWVPFAQRHLYTTLLVSPAPFHFDDPDRSARRLLAVLQDHPEIALLVRRIRFRKARGKRGPVRADALVLEMPGLLEACTGVESIAVSEVGLVDLGWMAHLHRLHSLSLHETAIDQPAVLPALVCLELSAQYHRLAFQNAFQNLPFDPTLFPSLREVRIHRCSPFQFADSLPALETLYISDLHSPPLSPTVTAMGIFEAAPISIPILWDRSNSTSLWKLLSHPPYGGYKIKYIRYVPEPNSSGDDINTWAPAFEAARVHGTDLRVVFLPVEMREEEGMEEFLVACGRWAVEVVFEEQGTPLVSARFRDMCRTARVEKEMGMV